MGAKACLILNFLLLSCILIAADVAAREMLQEPQTGVGLKSDFFVDGERDGTIGGGALRPGKTSKGPEFHILDLALVLKTVEEFHQLGLKRKPV